MTLAETLGGPVSLFTEAELRKKIGRFGPVAWYDTNGHFEAFMERMAAARDAGQLPYPVYRFRGSYLELMLELEDVAKGTERPPLVLYFPNLSAAQVADSPIYELCLNSASHTPTLAKTIANAAAGKVRTDQLTTFQSQPELSLETADLWLNEHVTQGEAGVGSQLNAMQLTAVFDDLLHRQGWIGARVTADVEAYHALVKFLNTRLGLPEARGAGTLFARLLPEANRKNTKDELMFDAAAWALAVEYVHDLKRAPAMTELGPATALPGPVVRNCCEVAAHLRNHQPDYYRRTATETEYALEPEVNRANAEDLGKVDTFRFEEDTVLKAAIRSLAEADKDQAAYERASRWAKLRLEPKPGKGSFWLRESPERNAAWQLVDASANLGLALQKAGARLSKLTSIDEAMTAYAERGALVDHAHRVLEQRRVAHFVAQLPDLDLFRSALDTLRERWRRWADAWAKDFNELCRTAGFLPSAGSQQRTLFDDVVKPMAAESGTTALFLVDALRYEMGLELFEQLKGTPQTQVELLPRLAELPTITAVGMNVLAPVVSGGRLAPAISAKGAFDGFSTGEYRVKDPNTRLRAMHAAVGGKTCPKEDLEKIVDLEPKTLKNKVAQARLFVVHSQEIDAAGESNVGPGVFDLILQRLRAAWQLLRDAGVKRFVITSDHGFLLVTPGPGSAQAHGRPIDPHRRHVFSNIPADHTGEVRVPLADLGYGDAPGHLMFPETTAVFNTGNTTQNFVHGGNSLQERVIPVLTIVHKAAAGGSLLKYRITAKRKAAVAGIHCIAFTLNVEAQTALDFGSSKAVELALRTPGSDGVEVELVQVRSTDGSPVKQHARSLEAPVGCEVEVFFHLLGGGGEEQRVPIELFHPGAAAEVIPFITPERFTVSANVTTSDPKRKAEAALPQEDQQSSEESPSPDAAEEIPADTPVTISDDHWLEALPEWARPFFKHLQAHKEMTEGEAIKVLGSARALRRLAKDFEIHAQKAPFLVTIKMNGGVKQYKVEKKQ